MGRMNKMIELVVSHMKSRTVKHESREKIRYCRYFLGAQRTVFTIGRQEESISFICRFPGHPAKMCVQAEVEPKCHYIVYQPPITQKIKIKKSNRIALKMEVFRQKVVMAITRRKFRCF